MNYDIIGPEFVVICIMTYIIEYYVCFVFYTILQYITSASTVYKHYVNIPLP